MNRDDWDQRYSASGFEWGVAPNRFVEAELADAEPGWALDVACGEGRNAVWLATKAWSVTAVDFSAVGLDKGRQLAEGHGVGERVSFVLDDVTTYRPKEGAYDLVLVCYLQLPAPARRAAITNALTGLAPRGVFLWIAHDRSNLEGGFGGPQSPEVLSSPADVVAELTGLDVERAEVVERPVERDGERHVALDTLVRARRPR